jgi:CheY-like chemotaxis protein
VVQHRCDRHCQDRVPVTPAADRLPVLLLSPDPDIRDLLAAYLTSLGGHVTVSECPRAALRFAAEHQHGLVITDLALPGVDGVRLVRDLHAHPQASRCKLVVTSSRDRAEYPEGIDGALPQPFARRDVARLLDRLALAGTGQRGCIPPSRTTVCPVM